MAIAILGISIKCPPVQMYLSRTQYKYSDSFSFQNAASAEYSYPTSPVGKIRIFSLHPSFFLPHQEHLLPLPDYRITESGGRIHRIPPCPTRSL